MKDVWRNKFVVERYERELEKAYETIIAQREEIERQEIEIEDLRCTIVDLKTELEDNPITITLRITLE